MLDQRFQEEIDACRPGSHDLDEPEMSPLAEALAHDPALRAHYDATQRLDARLVDAFAAVAVPADLAARLLAGLQRSAESQPAVTDARVAAPVSTAPAVPAPATTLALPHAAARRPLSRRRVLTALAASVLAATGVWTVLRSTSTPAAGELSTEAAQWFADLNDHWQPIAEAPANLPLPSAVVGKSRGWQAVTKTVARRGVVYSLAKGAKSRAVLFVLSAKRPGLPSTVPLEPQSTTGGLTIGAWQSQGLVYVLVVQGDERAYRRFLQPGRQPLA
ncbi:MAG TPA: hypothetical protein VHY91_26385 [Pirellulales bacterium]|jgi:hypothetical protein|nr:hypothetical protein [Pirellulales bacterium]